MDRMWRRMQNIVAWGQTTTAVQDGGPTPTVQGRMTSIETKDGLQILGHFGVSSSPPPGARFMALFAGGDKSRGVIVGTVDPASRRKGLAPGETAVHDMWGNEVHLSQAGVTVKHATKVIIQAPNVLIQASGGLRVEGPVTATGEITAHCDSATPGS